MRRRNSTLITRRPSRRTARTSSSRILPSAQLRQQISDGEAALQELKHSSAEAFKSAQASMESQKQAAADSLGLLESSLKSKDAEILELKTGSRVVHS